MPVRQYRCTKGFSWPADAAIRQRLMGGEKIDRKECTITQCEVGDTFVKRDLPLEVFDNVLRREAIALVVEPEPE